LELDIPTHDKSDILRVPTVFVPVPILLVDSEDPCVIQVAEHILSKTEGYSDYLKIAAALYFVQSAIRYTSDQALYGCHEFWASPCETLHFHKGDCEDTSVLLMSILGAMGYDSVLLDYDGHEAVGVRQGDQPAPDYLYCETASDDLMKPGFGDSNGVPTVYVPGETSELMGYANGIVASYRNMIQRVAGT
jgi:transglutaminase-like putative cysteine protease